MPWDQAGIPVWLRWATPDSTMNLEWISLEGALSIWNGHSLTLENCREDLHCSVWWWMVCIHWTLQLLCKAACMLKYRPCRLQRWLRIDLKPDALRHCTLWWLFSASIYVYVYAYIHAYILASGSICKQHLHYTASIHILQYMLPFCSCFHSSMFIM